MCWPSCVWSLQYSISINTFYVDPPPPPPDVDMAMRNSQTTHSIGYILYHIACHAPIAIRFISVKIVDNLIKSSQFAFYFLQENKCNIISYMNGCFCIIFINFHFSSLTTNTLPLTSKIVWH
jgi:hypothetical protein